MTEERVQKILARYGIASRRRAEELIVSGRVRSNGRIVQLGDKADPEIDRLEIDGKKIEPANRPETLYILINKPLGTVSTCYDPRNRPTVLDLLPEDLRRESGLHPVGRLDIDTTGALLLTNDGQLTLTLTHPRYHLPKTYRVWLDRPPRESDLARWREGILLDGRKTLPARVRVLEKAERHAVLEVILTEGRNRQIRRVARELGYTVLKLHRSAIGRIQLNAAGVLSPGQYRFLSPEELNELQNQLTVAIRERPETFSNHVSHSS
jgi:23S rRNA pseudouridine2605 synthase